MSNSSLVTYTRLSPNCNKPRKSKIDTVTIHCTAGRCSVETLGNIFASHDRKASCNYGIGDDGRIALIVDEANRSWCSSNAANDNRAVTIEVSSDNKEPYAVSEAAMNSLIKLLADICKRNCIEKLIWSVNKDDRINHRYGANMTVHRDFANKSCPGSYLYGKHGWIAAQVNSLLQEKEEVHILDKVNMTHKEIFDFFVKNGCTEEGIAGLMGNLMNESGIRADNLQNTFEKKLGMTDRQYADALNSRAYTREQFCRDGAGWGIAQWTFYNRKQNLWDYAESTNQAMDSMKMQVEFLLKELKSYYQSVWRVLTTSHNIRECSDIVLTQFEKPKNQSEAVKQIRYDYAVAIYKECKGDDTQSLKTPFLVKVERDDLNVRKGPGTNYEIIAVCPKGTFTIIEVKQGKGSPKGWGLKKAGGWISLNFVTIL